MNITNKPKTALEILQEAKIFAYKVRSGEITYEQGKAGSKPLLDQYNEMARKFARKLGRTWYDLNWSKLARMV